MHGSAHAATYSGTWSISPSDTPGDVQLEMRYHSVDASGVHDSEDSDDVPAPQIRDGSFTLVEDAGRFDAHGTYNGSIGAGTWTFVPNPQFASQLQRRGVAAPGEMEQFRLALAHFKLSTLDTLLAAGFQRPDAGDLVRMCNHGVTSEYISAMKGLDFSPKTVESLIRLHDHGVSTKYMHDLWRLGFHPSAGELVRLRDHGVTAAFIERLRSHGYTTLTADDLIRLRDHGF